MSLTPTSVERWNFILCAALKSPVKENRAQVGFFFKKMFCVSYKEQLSFISRQHWTTGFGLKYNHLISAINSRVFLVFMIMHFRFRHRWRKHFVPDQEHRQKKSFIAKKLFSITEKGRVLLLFQKSPNLFFTLGGFFYVTPLKRQAVMITSFPGATLISETCSMKRYLVIDVGWLSG